MIALLSSAIRVLVTSSIGGRSYRIRFGIRHRIGVVALLQQAPAQKPDEFRIQSTQFASARAVTSSNASSKPVLPIRTGNIEDLLLVKCATCAVEMHAVVIVTALLQMREHDGRRGHNAGVSARRSSTGRRVEELCGRWRVGRQAPFRRQNIVLVVVPHSQVLGDEQADAVYPRAPWRSACLAHRMRRVSPTPAQLFFFTTGAREHPTGHCNEASDITRSPLEHQAQKVQLLVLPVFRTARWSQS